MSRRRALRFLRLLCLCGVEGVSIKGWFNKLGLETKPLQLNRQILLRRIMTLKQAKPQ